MTGPDPSVVASSTQRLLETLDGVDPAVVTTPSMLPGWTIGHVLTHIARNADGNRRMLDGAARGEVLEQYVGGAEGRAAAIEAGAARSLPVIVSDVRESAAALADSLSAMPAEAWERPVRAFAGEYPASWIVPRRRREVEIHHVDLGLAYRPIHWPADMVATELAGAAAAVGSRLPLGTALRMVATDTGGAWEVGDGPASVAVSGPAAWLLAWLLGRRVPAGTLHAPAGLPPLRAWG
jgi:maleylpyruvate isomerase